jgi:hypothetical protein
MAESVVGKEQAFAALMAFGFFMTIASHAAFNIWSD